MKRFGLLPIAVLVLASCENASQPVDEQALSTLAPQLAITVPSETDVSVTVLGFGQANDINQPGQVVGYGWNADDEQIAVMWDRGEMIDLGAPPGVELQGVAINDRGQVVIGIPRFASSDPLAFLWERGKLTLIAADARVTAINSRGQVTGWHLDGSDVAFVWRKDKFTYISPLSGYTATRVFDVNDGGTVVGFFGGGGLPTTAFVWDKGTSQLLSTPDGYTSRAFGINNRGDVVGRINSSDGVEHAALWRNGVLVELEDLGGTNSHAEDINARGEVVGRSQLFQRPPAEWTRPVLWYGGEVVNLGRPLGDEYAGPTTAAAINNRGHVVGSGGWDLRAYIWTP